MPAQRTLLMLAVAAVGLWLARPGTATMVWLWALAAVLAWDPWAVLAAGFWLSFGAVGLLLYGSAGRIGAAPAPTVAARAARALRAAAHAQWLVTVGMVPLTLALFQQVSLISPLANALAIPVVTFAIVPLALAGIVVPVDALWQFADALLGLLLGVLEALARAPDAVWQQHAPPAWALPAALVGRRLARGAARRAGTLPRRWIWLLPLFVVAPPRPAAGDIPDDRARRRPGTRRRRRDADAHAAVTTPARATPKPPTPAGASSRRSCAPRASRSSTSWSSPTRTATTAAASRAVQAIPVALLLSSLPTDDDTPESRLAAGRDAQRCVAGSAGAGTACVHAAASVAHALRESAHPQQRPVLRAADRLGLGQRAADRRHRGGERAGARRARTGSARGRRPGRPAPRQPHVVDAGVRRRGGAGRRGVHARATATASAIRGPRSSPATRAGSRATAPTSTAR